MTDEVRWDESLSVGVREIDEQHKALIERIAAISRALNEHEGEREILRTLDFLMKYADFHFRAEEKLMAEARYPDLEKQRAEHERFRDMLRQLESDLEEEGATKALADSMHCFLMNWLTRHIRELDAPLSRFLASG